METKLSSKVETNKITKLSLCYNKSGEKKVERKFVGEKAILVLQFVGEKKCRTFAKS